MKKIYSLLSVLFLCSSMAVAQSPANRTTKTIVADVLAQMPAQQQGPYNNQVKDLISTGEEGIIQLVKMMHDPGKGENNKIEYALSALSHSVATKGQEEARATTAKAYVKALEMVSERETKAFVIRQLEIVGEDESVSVLAKYLQETSLSAPAAQTLAAIGSDAAGKVLLDALKSSSNKHVRRDLIQALGEMKMKGAESTLISLVGGNDPSEERAVMTALARIGTKESLPAVKKAAEGIGYKMNDTHATEAYIAIVERILKDGDAKMADKEAVALGKAGEKTGMLQLRQTGLKVQMDAHPANATKLLLKALKDDNKKYRVSALTSAGLHADGGMYSELVKTMQKSKPENKVEILDWFMNQCDLADSNRNALALRGNAAIIELLSDNDLKVQKAAANTLAKSGGHNAILALAKMLASKNPESITIAKEGLMQIKGDVSTGIAPQLASYTDAGKVAGLEVIGNRMSSVNASAVYGLLDSGSTEVKNTAYKTLKDISTEKDLPRLYTLLESANVANASAVQQAISVALKNHQPAKQYETLFAQMNKTSKEKQGLYYPILASTGADKALSYIVNAFQKESGANKDAAFQALLDWKGQEAAEELYAIAKDNSVSTFHAKAIDRYIELASTPKLSGENRRLLLTQAMEVAKTDAQRNTILRSLSRTNSYLGMILASQYLDNKAVQESAALAVMNIALSNKSFTGPEVEALLNKVSQVLNNPDAGYQREAIKKHLNELPKESGYVSIFNGKNIDGWKGLVGNPISRSKMKPAELNKKQAEADALAQKHWLVEEEGVLYFNGGAGDNLCTTKQYADFEMLVDWNLDTAGPEADAGVYLRGAPQVQIWDISRTNVGAEVGSGGLYNNNPNPSKPLKVADNKLGEWNTLYIKMVGDRVTVKLNGELVVDNIILDNYWDRKQPIFAKEQIELQAHGSKVYYRNIYVKELKSAEPFQLSAEEKKEGYKVLFDGTNMHQWTGNNVDYKLEEGSIVLDPKGGHGGNLYTKDEYSDFTFRFEFQLTPGGNNGLGIRTPLEGDAAYVGMELQILDNDAPEYSDLEIYQYHGSVYGIIPAKRGALKPMGEWNYQEVVAKGDDIKITLNGTVILEGNLKEATKNGTADGKDHPGLKNKSGHIGFLGHGSPVKFRNIRIKELK